MRRGVGNSTRCIKLLYMGVREVYRERSRRYSLKDKTIICHILYGCNRRYNGESIPARSVTMPLEVGIGKWSKWM